MKDIVTASKEERYGFTSALYLDKDEKVQEMRKFLRGYFKELATVLIRHYLADPRAIDIDIQIAVTPKETRP